MRRFILGTDWWTDCDDAVALRLLARAVKRGDCALLGICVNACMEDSIASLTGFLATEGLTGIPMGLDAAATDFGGRPPYQKRLAALAPHVTNRDAEEAVRLYRRLLAEAETPVELMEIGYPQALTAALLSQGDDISPKDGMTLFREKVKQVWMMAGKWDADGETENNFCRNARSRRAGKAFCEACPVPVTFLGWEVGVGVLTGGHLPEDDPLHLALADHGSAAGRHSWDPMLVQLALHGDPERAGYTVVRGRAAVDGETGANFFTKEAEGPHAYVVKAKADAYYADEINRLL